MLEERSLMSVTKYGTNNRWMSQIRVTDWKGNTIHKKKRGFLTKKEALQWERETMNQASGSLGMMFHDFVALYFADMENRLKPSTISSKRFLVELKIMPFFGRMALNDIKPTDVRRWQNQLATYRNEKDEPYAPTYLREIQNQLTAIFNYAVKYYGLKENPCHKAGSMGKKNADEMQFWTKAEFDSFIEAVADKPASYAIFMTLYYTGMREGELLALTLADIDFEKSTITINKSYQRINREDVITTPKTPKSNRDVRVKDKAEVLNDEDIKKAIEEVTEVLGDDGRILVRESGTEPLIRVMVEAQTDEICHENVLKVVNLIKEKGYAVK